MARKSQLQAYGGRPQRSVGRRIARVVTGLVVTAVLLGGALVLVDMGLRDFAETRAESEIKRRVPGSSVSADVTINGFSMLYQVVQGELEDVDVSFTIAGEGLSRLASTAGYSGDVSVVEGAVSLASEVDVLGVVVPFSVALEPTLEEDGYLLLTAVSVSAIENVELDLTQFVDLGAVGVRVCSASLLPSSLELTGVTVVGDRVKFTAHGSAVPTDLDALSVRGECVSDDVEAGAEPAA